MDFPILSLLDDARAEEWLLNHFHPQGLHCPHCDASVAEARHFRTTKTSRLQVYRCKVCKGVYNLYSGTVFAQKQYRPSQVVLLLQGICKGISSAQLARELNISRQVVLSIRRVLQDAAQTMQPEDALPDTETETDEMFQNAGEKGEPHQDPKDPPRRRGNKRRGHGTWMARLYGIDRSHAIVCHVDGEFVVNQLVCSRINDSHAADAGWSSSKE